LLLSRLARRDVTVVLSGDGGDECFGGYSRHLLTQQLGFLLNSNRGLRRATATGIAFLARGLPESFATSPSIPGQLRRAVQGDRLNRLAEMVGGEQADEIYWRAMRLSELQPAAEPMPSDPATLPPLQDLLSDFILRDMLGYLPGDILVKLDRASMATSLEARCPILDHRIVEFSWALPTTAKVRHGKGKWILRQVLERYLPRRLFDRPKQGFDVPVGAWLRGPLRSWADDLLCQQNLRKHSLLNAPLVERCWLEHLAGRRDHSRILWAVLMLQSWLQTSAVISPAAQSLEPAE
jgi:asparagine synthase (glutamine-hydrolysing)